MSKKFFLIFFSIGVLLLSIGAGCAKNYEDKTVSRDNEVREVQDRMVDKNKDDMKMMDHTGMEGMEMDESKMIGVMKKDGSMMTVWQGNELMKMEKEIVLNDGTKITMDGKVMKKDGTEMMLKDGEKFSINGNEVSNEKKCTMKDCAMTKDGKECTMKDCPMMKDGKTCDMENCPMMKDDSKMMNMKSGSYEKYEVSKLAKAENGKVVLFFHASWCPSCKAANEDITKNINSIPENLSILDVDYDSSQDLKKKYGVTTQHTFVQVDKNGNMIKKWSGSLTLADLIKQVK